MNKEFIIQIIVAAGALVFPFITGYIQSRKQSKKLVYKRIRA
jgi:hypothetical protein